MNLDIPATVTFKQSLELTQSLLEQIINGQLSEQQVQKAVTDLVKQRNGARGFFVVYLTNEYSLPEPFFKNIILALKSAPEIVSELQTKNLAMSTATTIFHERNNDHENAESSRFTQQKTIKIIEELELPELQKQLQHLYQSLVNGEGSYQKFLERYNYDAEQKQAIKQVIENLSLEK